jgi:repressor LexA
MAKTYVSDLSIYLNDIGLLKKDLPSPMHRMAEFLLAIVEAVTPKIPTLGYNTGVRCRKRGCKGSVHASLQHADGRITWWCLLCEQNGVISGWYGTKWDHSAGLPAPPIVTYTPREGQYLAFIYYYTKLNRQAPAERDMQLYFQVTPPAVHDMVLKLEKHGFISREPGVPRSIRLMLKREELPGLE